MAIIKKFTIGVMPFAKMFRVQGLGGVAVDAVLRLRAKSLSDDYFSEVGVNAERTAYKLNSADNLNLLQLTEQTVTFTKDYYESPVSFDFRKVLDEFRLVMGAIQGVVNIQDIRRIGIVAECRYSVEGQSPSGWLRDKLLTFKSPLLTDKLSLRFEERQLATDGKPPDAKKADFINYIYSYHDSAADGEHPTDGLVQVELDVQRYFAPVFTGNIPDEVLKLHKHFDSALRRVDDYLKGLGATHGKR
jgi:hypothetical protein